MIKKHFYEIINGGFPILFRKMRHFYYGILNTFFFNPGIINPYTILLYLYYRKTSVPLRQVNSLHCLVIFSQILNSVGIEHFLTDGTLLGAVRQNSFAGRPADIDLIIRKEDYEKLFFSTIEIYNHGFRFRKSNDPLSVVKYKSRSNVYLEIQLFSLEKNPSLGDRYTFTAKYDNGSIRSDQFNIEQLNHPDDTIIYGYRFKIPANSNKFLSDRYGEDWMIPRGTTYYFNATKPW